MGVYLLCLEMDRGKHVMDEVMGVPLLCLGLGQKGTSYGFLCCVLRNCRNRLHFMDKPEPGREAPDELTRKSLIAISYSEPEKVLSSKLSSENINGENVIEEADCDGEEKCRSVLISISYQQSPEAECRPHEEFER